MKSWRACGGYAAASALPANRSSCCTNAACNVCVGWYATMWPAGRPRPPGRASRDRSPCGKRGWKRDERWPGQRVEEKQRQRLTPRQARSLCLHAALPPRFASAPHQQVDGCVAGGLVAGEANKLRVKPAGG